MPSALPEMRSPSDSSSALPMGEPGPKRVIRATPATDWGTRIGRSTSDSTTPFPGKWCRASAQASGTPHTATITVDTVALRRLVPSASCTSSRASARHSVRGLLTSACSSCAPDRRRALGHYLAGPVKRTCLFVEQPRQPAVTRPRASVCRQKWVCKNRHTGRRVHRVDFGRASCW